jgi:DNA-binding NarL/FixJ family response regulator
MDNSTLSVLMVTQPGRVQEGLQAVLTGTFQIQTVDRTQDGTSTMTRLAACHPDLVVLDADLPDLNIPSILRYIKKKRIKTRCLVLTDTLEQLAAAQTAGADSALLKGFSTEELSAVIQGLLGQNPGKEGGEHPDHR